MKAVILAGGLGTRLRPFTEVIPKPLLPLGERSLMQVQIQALKEHGFNTIFVATNYMSDYVEAFLGDGSKYGVKLRFSKEEKPLGTCGPLSLLKNELTEPFILVNGDILTRLNFKVFFDFAMRTDSVLTVATKTITTPFRFGNVMVDENDHIMHIEEKPDLKFEVLAGIYCMKTEIFSYIPDNTSFDIDTLIKTLLKEKQKVSRYQIHEYWLDIGQVEDYSKAREAYNEHFNGNPL
jgi:NDP-sugar pyrophosphorylase family protein